MTGSGSQAADSAALRTVLSEVVIPILLPHDRSSLPPDLPRRAIEVLDRVHDIEARWDSIAALFEDAGSDASMRALFSADDILAKKGRRVELRLSGKRTLSPPSGGAAARLGLTLSVEGNCALEFRSGAEVFDDPDVQKRFTAARQSLPRAAGADILAAAVLPQSKSLLGVNTPLKVNLLGFPFSLRFGIVVAEGGRIRLFAAGPVVKEIPI